MTVQHIRAIRSRKLRLYAFSQKADVVLALPLTFAWTRNRTGAAWRIPIA
jgi:hypothetical protein